MKKIILLLFVLSTTVLVFSESDWANNKRDTLFQIGLGFSGISYDPDLDNVLDEFERYGVDRVTVYIDFTLGYAFFPSTYLTIGINGVGDRLYDDYNYMQINSYLYSVGFRNYPFKKGLFLGADFGSTVLMLESDFGLEGTCDSGTGFDIKVGYDSDADGVSFSIGASINYYHIENEDMSSFSAYSMLNWK